MMTDTVAMLEKVEDRGGAAQPLLQVSGLTKHFPVRGGLFGKRQNPPPRIRSHNRDKDE